MAKKKVSKAKKSKKTQEKKKKSKKETEKKGAKPKTKSFKAALAGERVVSAEQGALDLYNRSRLGEVSEGKVYYSLIEALYLLEKKKLSVYVKKKKLTFDSLLQKAQELEKSFWARYCVYRDMRNRGYIVKTALKFGADFRVYGRGVKPGEAHAKWILFPVYETNSLTWHDFAAKNRVAHSTRKNLLIGIVDDEGDVTYYVVEWKRP